MAAIYINGKLCSGGTELVEEVQEGLTEAVTSDAVARYIKPVVQNVTSGVTNPVSSGAVYGALTNLNCVKIYDKRFISTAGTGFDIARKQSIVIARGYDASGNAKFEGVIVCSTPRWYSYKMFGDDFVVVEMIGTTDMRVRAVSSNYALGDVEIIEM